MLPSPVPVLVSTRWWGGWLPAPHSPGEMMDGWVGGWRGEGGGGRRGLGKGGGMELCLITKFVCKPASQAKDE